jgi:RNA polymerase sigma-70 factor (ECF subfamily)
MADRRTDAEVLAASLVEPRAFMVVFDRHFAATARYLGRRLRWSVAQELTAEVFATAFASRFRHDVRRADALPWCMESVPTCCALHARREERQLELLARTAAVPWRRGSSRPTLLQAGHHAFTNYRTIISVGLMRIEERA